LHRVVDDAGLHTQLDQRVFQDGRLLHAGRDEDDF
jgi:hypothetical protein